MESKHIIGNEIYLFSYPCSNYNLIATDLNFYIFITMIDIKVQFYFTVKLLFMRMSELDHSNRIFVDFVHQFARIQSTMIYNWFLLQEQFFITALWFLPFYAIILLYLITSLTYFKLDFCSQKMILRARLVLSDMSAYFVDLITPSKKSYNVCMSYKHNVHCMPRLEVAYRLGTSIHHLFLPPLLNISFKNNLQQS